MNDLPATVGPSLPQTHQTAREAASKVGKERASRDGQNQDLTVLVFPIGWASFEAGEFLNLYPRLHTVWMTGIDEDLNRRSFLRIWAMCRSMVRRSTRLVLCHTQARNSCLDISRSGCDASAQKRPNSRPVSDTDRLPQRS